MNIKRADFSRYLIVLKYGGLYIDLDMALKGPPISEVRIHTADLFASKNS
jgi:mannosyltransferase OCH1-like enzyme